MPRIVSGTAKGTTIKVPKSARPTPDMVREAIFSRLEHRGYLDNTDVLDVYAGSGAFGLEAASRGARTVTAVDANREAVSTIKANAKKTGLDVLVVNQKAEAFLGTIGRSYDLIFLDPPYDMAEEVLANAIAKAAPLLVHDGLLLVERDKHSPEPTWPSSLVKDDEKIWGDTVIWSALGAEYARSLDS